MRLSRLRFTVRWLMVAVAVAAVPLASVARSARLAALGRRHSAEAQSCYNRAMDLAPPSGPQPSCGTGEIRRWMRLTPEQRVREDEARWGGRDSAAYRMARLWWYHDALAQKYERAAERPWLPVEPDPPEPK